MHRISPAPKVPWNTWPRSATKALRALAAAVLLTAHGAPLPVHAANATLTVTTDNDRPDDQPGDGKCNNAGFLATQCSLRAAIMEANALPGTNTILVPPGTYVLSRAAEGTNDVDSGDLNIRHSVTIKPTTSTGRVAVRGGSGAPLRGAAGCGWSAECPRRGNRRLRRRGGARIERDPA